MCSRLKVTREFGFKFDADALYPGGLNYFDLMNKRADFTKIGFSDATKVIEDMNATILASAKKSADPPIYKDGKYFDVTNTFPGGLNYLDIPNPKSWPYTLHDTDERPFNLNHGYMWGRHG